MTMPSGCRCGQQSLDSSGKAEAFVRTEANPCIFPASSSLSPDTPWSLAHPLLKPGSLHCAGAPPQQVPPLHSLLCGYRWSPRPSGPLGVADTMAPTMNQCVSIVPAAITVLLAKDLSPVLLVLCASYTLVSERSQLTLPSPSAGLSC